MMIMKKVFKSLFVIVAAMITFAGCAKQEIDAPATSETKTVQFFAESIETKTAFGTPNGTTYPTLWTGNETIKLLLNLNEEAVSEEVVESDDYTSASFNAEVKVDGSVAPYKFSAISPSTAYLGKTNERFAVTIPTDQTPTENSVDEAAQILYAVSESFDELPESVSLNFKHFTAYGKLSFVNLNLGDAKVNSVAITSSVDFANRWNCFVADESFGENSGASTITLNTSATQNLWFACAPVGDMNGNTLTFTVNTDKGPLSKTVTLGENHRFEAGRIANMKVDMTGIEFTESKVYELVTDASDLTVDSEIIIVASDYDYALSTTQNNNNRAQAVVTKSDDKSTITDPGNDVQVITIEDGLVDESLAFNVGDGYLYAASSSSNHLKTQTTNNNNGSWIVTISEGIATIKAQGANTRNWLKYNSTNNPPIFSCYGSGQKDVSIYKLQGSGTVKENYLEVSPNAIEVEADATTASFTVSSDLEWTASSDNATVSNVGNTVSVSFDANEDTEEKTYTVTVSASGVDPQVVTITQAGKVDTNFEAGQYWIMATKEGKTKVLTPLADGLSYGYGPSTDVTDNRSYAKNAFTFTEVVGGFTIQDASGKYYYSDATHLSFQLTTDSSTEGIVWSVTVQNDGTYVLTNVATERTMKYGDGTYTTFGVYLESDADTGVYPTLVKADNPLSVELSSISVSGHKTSFTEGDSFEFGGTVTATYTDGSTKDVTSEVSYTTPEMVDGAKVTVSYTEGTVTKSFDYTISVKAEGAEGELVTETFDLRYSATDVKSADWEISQNGVSLSWSKGTSNNTPSPNKEGSVRMYAGTTLTISSPTNTKITRVVFTPTSTSYSATKLKYNDVALSSDDWTLSEPVNEIVLTASANARFKEIVVYYN